MTELNSETLLDVGFIDVGVWVIDGDRISYRFHEIKAEAAKVWFAAPNALYAFVRGDQVLYIGKTARSLRKRFRTYCRPGPTQSTNIRCNANIKRAIAEGAEVRLFVFTPISQLRYNDFEINLAAGLEDALIRQFDPPWNGHDRGQPITEEAEREEAEEAAVPGEAVTDDTTSGFLPAPDGTARASFKIRLGEAYYHQGIINPGVEASRYLGDHGDPIEISFADGSEPIYSSINRTANPSESVRLVGRNRQIATWFQRHYRKGEVVEARVLDAHRIFLMLPPSLG
jgi:hypothetical protein